MIPTMSDYGRGCDDMEDGYHTHRQEDADYAALLTHLRTALSKLPPGTKLFTTDADGGYEKERLHPRPGQPLMRRATLYDVFLDHLPESRRQHYKCRACRKFVETYGGLVTIDEDGWQRSPFWSTPPSAHSESMFFFALDAMYVRIGHAKVTGVFLTGDGILGQAFRDVTAKGTWNHMCTAAEVTCLPHRTVEQVQAEKREEYGMLCRGLADFSYETVQRAHALLTTGQLYRSEKCIGVAKWLVDLHSARMGTKDRRLRENITWKAVASAPPGFCHVRSTMIGTLLEDIQAGKDFSEIKRAFDGKMSPVKYQRPTAAPSDGQLAEAERIVAELGVAGALERRFARMEDIRGRAIWLPRENGPETRPGGVFRHLKKKSAPPEMDVPSTPMTWEKFSRTVLPNVVRMEFLVPRRPAGYFAFVTAVNPDAPAILQWDPVSGSGGGRNPVSWYLYQGGENPFGGKNDTGRRGQHWNLAEGTWVDVEALTMQPSMWGPWGIDERGLSGSAKVEHHGNGLYFILKGAKDLMRDSDLAAFGRARGIGAGIALFPEILKSEYHGIRKAIEAYSKSKTLPPEANPVCGVCQQKASTPWRETFRVTTYDDHGGTMRQQVVIDRWD